jgi:hypothetical protein
MGQTAIKQKQKVSAKLVKKGTERNSRRQNASPARDNGTVLNQKFADRRENLNIKATKEELESLLWINTREEVAAEAARFKNYPAEAAKENILMFIEAALDVRAEALILRRKWWKEIKVKYPELPIDKQNVFVDFDTNEFYVVK